MTEAAGQKRKARGGNSLETVADFIFKYYNFNLTDKPTHFAADLEIDKWFFKIREIWRFITYDSDYPLSRFIGDVRKLI